MKSEKQRAQDILDRLPDDASTELIMTELMLVKTIDDRLADVARGETVPQEEAKRRLAKWLKSTGR